MQRDDGLQELLDSLDPTTRTLVAEVDLGEQAKAFLQGDLGKYILGCASQEILEAQEALALVLPWRRRRIQELQNRIWRAKSLLSWLRDLLSAGRTAESALEEVETGD